jgi:3-oxoacyl-(acyl-carrier-protein) synthase
VLQKYVIMDTVPVMNQVMHIVNVTKIGKEKNVMLNRKFGFRGVNGAIVGQSADNK